MSPLIGVREEGWDKALSVNLKSVYLVCRAAGPHLINQRRGSVINVASVAGARGSPLLRSTRRPRRGCSCSPARWPVSGRPSGSG